MPLLLGMKEKLKRQKTESKDEGKKVLVKSPEIDESESSNEAPKEKEGQKVSGAPKLSAYKPKVPFSARLMQQLDQQFSKFLEIFNKLHVNISFIDALRPMPLYAKFLKEILGNKRKLEDC